MAWCVGGLPVQGFNGHVVKDGGLELEIGEFPAPTVAGEAVEVPVVLRNRGNGAVDCELRLQGLVDEWRSVGEARARVRVAKGGEVRHRFRIRAEAGVEQALYPVHVTALDGKSGLSLHAVRVFESVIPKPVRSGDGILAVPENGVVSLVEAADSRVAWELVNGGGGERPRAWTGSDPATGTSRVVHEIDRGGRLRAMVVHPPWKAGAGVMRCEMQVRLPETRPLLLEYATAVRDPDPDGASGDGVTFRVRIDEEEVAVRHHGSRTWMEQEVDLARWAGKTVTLTLETHPGPTMNTAFDSAYWGAPVIRSGPKPRIATEAEVKALMDEAKRTARGGDGLEDVLVELENDARVALLAGPNGLFDGLIRVSMGGKAVRFGGLETVVEGSRPGGSRSSIRVVRLVRKRTDNGALLLQHHCVDAKGPFVFEFRAWAEDGALRLKADCPRRITRLALAPADQKARRVYAGHGYVIESPQKMHLGFGGHGLASSHVAVEYEEGLTLLTASDHPPVAFEIDPGQRRYSLVTRYDATLTLLPGTKGGMDAAIRYRPLYDKPAAPGVEAKAGRFVFDYWGGRYGEIADLMRSAIDYGLTDSMLTVHNWQRWGYDYRLPDIYPPNPRFGTVEELREVSRLCREHGIPWGLHDNYIDFYPDAEGYSYEHIAFHEGGGPVKAWINKGRNAQSYRWRPDAFQPFLKRNLELIVPDLAPTHSFVDVFTSIPPVEFHDRTGGFHSALETRRHWGEAFVTIREALKGPSITSSEAGHDQLTGYLDGADCQFLRLSPEPGRFLVHAPCADWERVPWMDAVLHDRFILHGVGYSGRYQGGLERPGHGIESDDYLGVELLTGHALMIDTGAGLQGAVRKYWLAQAVARALAMDEIEAFRWVDGDIHRPEVRWAGGMRVRVNRGTGDWTVDGRVLPANGILAENGTTWSVVERIDGRVVEHSAWPGGYYVNSRTGRPAGAPLPMSPRPGKFEAVGPLRFKLPVRWTLAWPAKVDAGVFLHVLGPEEDGGPENILAQGDHRPEVPVREWNGAMVTGEGHVVSLPPDLAAGRYEVVAGLFNRSGRFALLGEAAGRTRYRVGTLVVAANGALSFEPGTVAPPEIRGNPPGTMVDFGPVVTDGATRVEEGARELTITPLPDSGAMRVELRVPQGWPVGGEWSAVVVGRDGTDGEEVPATLAGARVVMMTRPGDFAYRLRVKDGHKTGTFQE
jgi:hypothetical protein